jgi:hypothetical protein
MNEQPDYEGAEVFIVCVNSKGNYLTEDGDGRSTWLEWVSSPTLAKRYSNPQSWGNDLHPVSDYQTWPKPPEGCRMMWCRLNTTAWLRETRL